MDITSLTDYSASKVAKIIVRCKIVSVRAERCVSQPSSTPEKPIEGKSFCFSVSRNAKRSPRLAVKRLDQLHSRTCTSQGLSPPHATTDI